MRYLFPPNNRACNCNYTGQARKIGEESEEVMVEAVGYVLSLGTPSKEACRRRLLMETLDVIHACESMLRKFDQQEVQAAYIAVIEKNSERGDYDD